MPIPIVVGGELNSSLTSSGSLNDMDASDAAAITVNRYTFTASKANKTTLVDRNRKIFTVLED